jgi:hypothetical protein
MDVFLFFNDLNFSNCYKSILYKAFLVLNWLGTKKRKDTETAFLSFVLRSGSLVV